jgi:hypothetical protein
MFISFFNKNYFLFCFLENLEKKRRSKIEYEFNIQ